MSVMQIKTTRMTYNVFPFFLLTCVNAHVIFYSIRQTTNRLFKNTFKHIYISSQISLFNYQASKKNKQVFYFLPS